MDKFIGFNNIITSESNIRKIINQSNNQNGLHKNVHRDLKKVNTYFLTLINSNRNAMAEIIK